MPGFSNLFNKSKGKPFEYNGKTIMLVDSFSVEGDTKKIAIKFETTNSKWKQGIAFELDKGAMRINSKDIGKGAVLWEDTAPNTVYIEIIGSPSCLYIKNVWDTGNGAMQSWHHGAAMFAEDIDQGRRYYCNDGEPDDDFNDIIFTIQRVHY